MVCETVANHCDSCCPQLNLQIGSNHYQKNVQSVYLLFVLTLCFNPFISYSLQYFSPYLSVDLHKMASAFNTSVSYLEDELTQLILDGQISARIDSHAKVRDNTNSMSLL